MNILRPVPGGFYDGSADGIALFDDLVYLLDADSHHHREPCGIWCPRRDVLVTSIPDSEDGGVSQ